MGCSWRLTYSPLPSSDEEDWGASLPESPSSPRLMRLDMILVIDLEWRIRETQGEEGDDRRKRGDDGVGQEHTRSLRRKRSPQRRT